MTYLIDADVMLQAKRIYYRMHIVPGYWDWLSRANEMGVLYSNESVYPEIVKPGRRPDDAAQWAMERKDSFFLDLPKNIDKKSGHITKWLKKKYDTDDFEEFSKGADLDLVKHAHAGGFVLVTQESTNTNWKAIKIPNVCKQFGIECVGTFELLEREGVRLGLEDYTRHHKARK